MILSDAARAQSRRVFPDGETVTVRGTLTGSLSLLQNPNVDIPDASGGSDSRAQNFTDHGEFVFRGRLTVPTTPYIYDGVFAAAGPDLGPVAVGDSPPVETRLEPTAPNPTRGATTLSFELAHAGLVRLEICDLSGRLVRTLRNGYLLPAHYSDRWRGEDDAGRSVASGIYFARLVAPGVSALRRVVELR